MPDPIWTWILNQSINRRGYRTEPGTRSILWLAAIILLCAAIALSAMIWFFWPSSASQR